MTTARNGDIRAVFWDFGGVILTSPFEAFNRYEDRLGIPRDFIRGLNTRNPDHNAWAKLERSEVEAEQFCALFEAEAEAAGHRLDGREVLACLAGEIRPEMVTALKRVAVHYKTACLTNNVRHGAGPGMARSPELAKEIDAVMAIFDTVIESSRIGARKPEPRFYETACRLMEVRPSDVVFLDDLGINLRPARAMGMHTIKVIDPAQAIAELEELLGMELR